MSRHPENATDGQPANLESAVWQLSRWAIPVYQSTPWRFSSIALRRDAFRPCGIVVSPNQVPMLPSARIVDRIQNGRPRYSSGGDLGGIRLQILIHCHSSNRLLPKWTGTETADSLGILRGIPMRFYVALPAPWP